MAINWRTTIYRMATPPSRLPIEIPFVLTSDDGALMFRYGGAGFRLDFSGAKVWGPRVGAARTYEACLPCIRLSCVVRCVARALSDVGTSRCRGFARAARNSPVENPPHRYGAWRHAIVRVIADCSCIRPRAEKPPKRRFQNAYVFARAPKCWFRPLQLDMRRHSPPIASLLSCLAQDTPCRSL